MQLEYGDACQEREGSGRRGEACNQRSWRQWLGVKVPGVTAAGAGGRLAVDRGGGGGGCKRPLLPRVGRMLGQVRFIQELNAKRLADLLG